MIPRVAYGVGPGVSEFAPAKLGQWATQKCFGLLGATHSEWLAQARGHCFAGNEGSPIPDRPRFSVAGRQRGHGPRAAPNLRGVEHRVKVRRHGGNLGFQLGHGPLGAPIGVGTQLVREPCTTNDPFQFVKK